MENRKKLVRKRRTKNVNIIALKDDLLQSLQNINYDEEFSLVFCNFSNASLSIVDQYAPIISQTFNCSKVPPWIDLEFKKCRAYRRKLEKIWRREKSTESRSRYVEFRKVCADLATFKRKEYYGNLISSSNDQKTLFKIVNAVLDTSKE